MSHELDMSNGRVNMAFVGETPWHGLGHRLPEDADIDTWRTVAGMDWSLVSSPVLYSDHQGEIQTYPGRRILSRSDTHEALACVSNQYRVVQPSEVLEFYRDLVETAGFRLHTAGVLRSGRKYWALAELGESARIMGQDQMDGYLLLATACDGTLATRAMFTSVRVVCANTLAFAVEDADRGVGARRHIRVPHSVTFDPNKVKMELGLAPASWKSFLTKCERLADRKVSRKEALEWLIKVFGDANKPVEEQQNGRARVMNTVLQLFEGGGKGSNFRSSKDTAWGLVNAATEYCDHHARCRSVDARIDRAWFGDGAVLKQKAWDAAIDLLEAA